MKCAKLRTPQFLLVSVWWDQLDKKNDLSLDDDAQRNRTIDGMQQFQK